MSILLFLSFSYIAIFFSILLVISIKNISLRSSSLKILILIYAVSMAIIAFHVYPSYTWDLYRHMQKAELFPGSFIETYKYFVNYDGLYFFDAVIALAAKLNNPHIIPLVMVFITYLSMFEIINIILKSYKVTSSQVLMYIVVFSGLSRLELIFSTLRSTSAYAILAWGIINFLFNKYKNNSRRYLDFILCAIIAIGIHPSSWGIIIIFILFLIRMPIKILIILLLSWSLFYQFIANIALLFPGQYSLYFSNKISTYAGLGANDVRLIIVNFTCLIFIMTQLLVVLKYKKNLNKYEVYYLYFMVLMLAYAIGSFELPEMITRSQMFIAPMLLPLFEIEYKNISPRAYRFNSVIFYIYSLGMLTFSLYAFYLYTTIF